MIIRCIFVAKTYKLLLKTFNMVQNLLYESKSSKVQIYLFNSSYIQDA